MHQDKVGSIGLTKCVFKFNKQSDEYCPQAIMKDTGSFISYELVMADVVQAGIFL